MQRPDGSAILNLIGDLNRALDSATETQRKIIEVTGTAWSENRLIKAVVGPRGQLIDLQIDPRVYRTPNSTALAASILATVRAATDQAMAQTREIIDQAMPDARDILGTGPRPGPNLAKLMRGHDADLKKLAEEADDGDVR